MVNAKFKEYEEFAEKTPGPLFVKDRYTYKNRNKEQRTKYKAQKWILV